MDRSLDEIVAERQVRGHLDVVKQHLTYGFSAQILVHDGVHHQEVPLLLAETTTAILAMVSERFQCLTPLDSLY